MFSIKKSKLGANKKDVSPKQVGDKGESLAEKYLKKEGFSILERNFRCQGGEIDLIATKNKELHFIEVKTRTSRFFGSPLDSVTYFKKQRLMHASHRYLFKYKQWQNWGKMFSVMSIDTSGDEANIEFIPNAFEIEGAYY